MPFHTVHKKYFFWLWWWCVSVCVTSSKVYSELIKSRHQFDSTFLLGLATAKEVNKDIGVLGIFLVFSNCQAPCCPLLSLPVLGSLDKVEGIAYPQGSC